MHDTPDQLRSLYDSYLQAERQLFQAEGLKGQQLANALQNVANEGLTFSNNQATTVAQQNVTSAQQTYDAAQLMHDTPNQLRPLYDNYLNAEKALFTAEGLKGKDLTNALQGVANQQLQNNNTLSPSDPRQNLQDLVTLATLQHSPGGVRSANASLLAYDQSAGGMTATQLQIEQLQMQQQTGGFLTAGPQLIGPNQMAPGSALAGYGATSVGLATANTQTAGNQQMIRILQQQIAAQAQEIQLLQQLVHLGEDQKQQTRNLTNAVSGTNPGSAPVSHKPQPAPATPTTTSTHSLPPKSTKQPTRTSHAAGY